MLKVYNMTSERSGREVANQFVIEHGAKTMFQSYDSTIVEIDETEKTVTVYPHWDYSMTTGKYRNQFMCENGFCDMGDKKGFAKAMKEGKTSRRGWQEYTVKTA